MKSPLRMAMALTLIVLSASPALAESAPPAPLRVLREWQKPRADNTNDYGGEFAGKKRYCIVRYDFETLNWQGWTRLDKTAQRDSFFHVDDFVGLDGRLAPVEGAKSIWCGARPNAADPNLCSYRYLPGYGNRWQQMLVSKAFAFTGAITLSYHGVFDCEAGRDFLRVEYDAGDGDWREIASYTGVADTIASHTLYTTQARTKLRFYFVSDDRWSDEDALNTDGACILDSITVRDNDFFNHFSDFEIVPVGGRSDGFWYASVPVPYGSFSGLMTNLYEKDPCNYDLHSQIAFFIESPNPSSSYPGLYDTPFCQGPGNTTPPCQDEMVISPVIDLTKYSSALNHIQDGTIPPQDLPLLGRTFFEFDVYRDLPLRNLVFYTWNIRNITNGCPGPWLNRDFVYYGGEMDFLHSIEDVSTLITDHAVQVGVGVTDMCDAWFGRFGDLLGHNPAPYFDSLAVWRFEARGPQWWYSDVDLFQDNFPAYNSLFSWVRADCAADINAHDNPLIRPGDSIVVEVASLLGGGIAQDPTGGPAVYMHVRCSYIGDPAQLKPEISGSDLQGTYGRYLSVDVGGWTIIRADTARIQGRVAANKYAFDLNDSLLTNGYIVKYFFSARDNAGGVTTLPRWAPIGGPYFEFTCLPTLASDILFVDDCSGIGSFGGSVEDYWTAIFEVVMPWGKMPDRYDINGPSSLVSNGLASRARLDILMSAYKTIIWDSGDLDVGTITDGTSKSDKSNDCALLCNWMNYSNHDNGLWICGDNVAADLDGLGSVQALTLMNFWCGVNLLSTSYYDETGGRTSGGTISPLITGDADLNVFIHAGVPDTWFAFGGCPMINDFDCLEKTGNGKYATSYPLMDYYHAAIGCEHVGEGELKVRTMWFGHSCQFIRDDAGNAPIDCFHIAKDVIDWMGNETNSDVTGAEETPAIYDLSQNYPNPCNPSTMIRLSMKEKGPMTLKIYNVAGQLVRTLHEGILGAGRHDLLWDGRNNRGAAVASGVYFYEMQARNFIRTRKLVVLR